MAEQGMTCREDDLDQSALLIANERDRLVRLCIRLTGRRDIAEDLAHETIIEALRHRHKLLNPAGCDRWLTAIARNMCLRWLRRQSRDNRHSANSLTDVSDVRDDIDLEESFEHRELEALIDQGLALVPADVRLLLIQRYIQGFTRIEIAEHHGITEDALSMRLTRAKRALRQAFIANLPHETSAFGLIDIERDTWQETRLWCPDCGQQHLLTRMPSPPGLVSFRCPACDPDPQMRRSEFRLHNAFFAELIGGMVQPRAVLNRTARWSHTYFRTALETRVTSCTHCGHHVPLQRVRPSATNADDDRWDRLVVHCQACGESVCTSFQALVQSLPEVQDFWRDEGRIRTVPGWETDLAGCPVIVTRFASVSRHSYLDVISARETYDVLKIIRTSQTGIP